MRCGLYGEGFKSWQEQGNLLFFPCPDRLWGPLRILLSGYRGSFLRVKRPGRKVYLLPASSTEVKNEWR